MLWLCKPVSSKKRFAPFRQLDKDYFFSLYEKAEHIPIQDWQQLCPGGSIFLEREYLKIVECCGHSKLQSRYVIVYHKKRVCGLLYFQVIDFKAGVFGEMISGQLNKMRSARLKLFERYVDAKKDEILLRLFTCGNNLVSGEYGFVFSEELNQNTKSKLLLGLMDLVAREEKLRGTISASLIKDFYEPLKPGTVFKKEGFSEFNIEPNMIVDIPERVNAIEDYVALFSKKYRKRYRSIFEARQGITEREMDPEDLIKYQTRMFTLYEAIFENAKFKLLKLPEDYFIQVKKHFSESFHLKGFFLGEEILAYSSFFIMPDGNMEAHYIGFDYSLNLKYNLYQNLLYGLIGEAIIKKSRLVNLGRTASEIKTTVGAKPHDLICYIKPQNTVSRLIQKPFISFLQPEPWVPRNPFREENENEKKILQPEV